MTFAPSAIICDDCHRLAPADDVERRPHETVLIAECRCGHVVSRVFPTLLSRASSRPPARDGTSRANRPTSLRRSPTSSPSAPIRNPNGTLPPRYRPRAISAAYLRRLRMSATCVAAHVPPRAVEIRRAFGSSAIFRKLKPCAFSGWMIGRTLAAKRSASAFRLSRPFPRTSARRGLPSVTPRSLAAASAAVVRAEMRVRSFSASAA
jgi:hypothetical protein